MYKRVCTYKENYIDDTKQNAEIRWEEHLDINKISEPSRYLKSNLTHAFTWKVLITAPIIYCVMKDLDPSFIAFSRPSLNEQIDAKK